MSGSGTSTVAVFRRRSSSGTMAAAAGLAEIAPTSASAAATLPASATIRAMNRRRSMPSWVKRS
jgi:hypothetical protein